MYSLSLSLSLSLSRCVLCLFLPFWFGTNAMHTSWLQLQISQNWVCIITILCIFFFFFLDLHGSASHCNMLLEI
jgi:hypothetical protein